MYKNTTLVKYVLHVVLTMPRNRISMEDKQRIVDAHTSREDYVENIRLFGIKKTTAWEAPDSWASEPLSRWSMTSRGRPRDERQYGGDSGEPLGAHAWADECAAPSCTVQQAKNHRFESRSWKRRGRNSSLTRMHNMVAQCRE